MRTIVLLLASAAIWTSSALAATQAGLWRCVSQDGSEIYTDQPTGLKECRKYELKSEARPTPKRSDTEVKLRPAPSSPAVAEERRLPEPTASGIMDFGTLNRLSLGMSEAEVLNIAGIPKSKLATAWVYAMPDASIVELRFGTGRIVEIRRHQLPQ